VVRTLEQEFGAFDYDVAADDHNYVCAVYLTLRDGAPNPHQWGINNFCNPPFGDIGPFVVAAAKAGTSAERKAAAIAHMAQHFIKSRDSQE